MKHLPSLLAAACLMAGLASCGSSKQAVKTYEQPCAEYMKPSKKVIRAWGIGKSDSEATARKKAQAVATAELAAQLQKTVHSVIEDYATVLTESEAVASKSLLVDKTKITVDQTLHGATVVCDKWSKDEQDGMYTNYVVMEVKPEAYVEAVKASIEDSGKTVDEALLRRLFLKYLVSE